MDRIVLKNMAFYGYHGDLVEETQLGQRFFVDVALALDLSKAGQSDDVKDTVSYADVYALVDEVMKSESYRLLERLATVVCEKIWKSQRDVVGVSVSVRKPSAPVPGIMDYAEVTINRGQI